MSKDYISKFDETISFFQKDITSLRTGRAAPSLVEDVVVDAYGTKTPIVQLASITAQDAKTIVIQPWDKSVLKQIESAIASADLNVNPIVDNDIIRISLPPLTEENRLNLVKQLHQKAEAARVSIRQHREKARAEIGQQEETGELTEDEKFKKQKDLDNSVKEYSDKIKEIVDAKEKEIMTV